jgi:hypothetical protein
MVKQRNNLLLFLCVCVCVCVMLFHMSLFRLKLGAYHVIWKRYDSTRFNNEINC